jgi:hypothetical protein
MRTGDAAGRLFGGKPVLHAEVRIVRPDGSDAGVGELDELCNATGKIHKPTSRRNFGSRKIIDNQAIAS